MNPEVHIQHAFKKYFTHTPHNKTINSASITVPQTLTPQEHERNAAIHTVKTTRTGWRSHTRSYTTLSKK